MIELFQVGQEVNIYKSAGMGFVRTLPAKIVAINVSKFADGREHRTFDVTYQDKTFWGRDVVRSARVRERSIFVEKSEAAR